MFLWGIPADDSKVRVGYVRPKIFVLTKRLKVERLGVYIILGKILAGIVYSRLMITMLSQVILP